MTRDQKTYRVRATWTMTRDIDIEADTAKEARELAHQWNESLKDAPEGDYVLNSFEADVLDKE
ncbi:hypothetical protein IMZ31_19235 (plasmid) [Pontibacillus sp. ALD_SL1]|uniref:hypothetical protein n=1 Tax=Pontibacillus sp. ALD_SL1 TaxID=2777185 RepID=UPI001A96EC7A|nr:hypothetical protein [Pontibacillus sp. ALD_SL1]QST02685.1 hypothetical protein IMZ31_19235 [Pontibacillus sp. ALD_SL1]